MGDWYSGSRFDSGTLNYINTIQGHLYNRPWPNP